MSNLRFGLLLGGGVLLIAFGLVGRPEPVDTTLHAATLSEDLDADLAAQEARFEDIIPGTEKIIVWANPEKTNTPLSIVYLHGFSACRQESAPLADTLGARWGANLFYTRLTGHGRPGEAMGVATANDWLNDAVEALDIGRRLGERVVLIGTSTGGTLAHWLALQPETQDLAALVLISPNYAVRATGADLVLWPWGAQLLRLVRGDYIEWEPANEAHGLYWTTRYPSSAVVEMMKMLKFVNSQDAERIVCPTLVLYSPNDQVVDPVSVEATFERIGASEKHLTAFSEVGDRNNHVLAGSILSPDDTRTVAAFIEAMIDELEETGQKP
jgi:esterase/lipase